MTSSADQVLVGLCDVCHLDFLRIPHVIGGIAVRGSFADGSARMSVASDLVRVRTLVILRIVLCREGFSADGFVFHIAAVLVLVSMKGDFVEEFSWKVCCHVMEGGILHQALTG